MTVTRELPKRSAPELLAPAADLLCLGAAIAAGCDAVYLGVAKFNMRQQATRNLTLAELPEARRLCQAHGVKLYVTLNAMIYENELAELAQTVAAVAPYADAIIAGDWATIGLCQEHGLPFHISTQMGIANSAAARQMRAIGASRVILARECALEEIPAIRAEGGIAVEAFVHGASCVSVSGRCFLSQDAFGLSCNRGECRQNCRREYEITEVEEGFSFVLGRDYVMSAKDLCSLPFLELLLQAGIDAFKIEGRSRNAEYVSTVVGCYRQAIDAALRDELTPALKQDLVQRCLRVYNHEFCSGYYFGRNISEFTSGRGSRALWHKQYVGEVQNYFKRPQVAQIRVESHLFRQGDTLMFQGPTTGVLEVVAAEIRRDGVAISVAERGELSVKVEPRVRVGDKVYVMVPYGQRPVLPGDDAGEQDERPERKRTGELGEWPERKRTGELGEPARAQAHG